MRRIVLLSLALFLLASFAGGEAARAQDGSDLGYIPSVRPIMTTYDVYVGGLHFLTAHILFDEHGNRYETHVHARTYGYLYKWLKWDGDILSEGRIENGRFIPVRYRDIDVWRNKAKEIMLDFGRHGDVKASFEPAGNGKDSNLVDVAARRDTLDPATALLQMLAHVASDGDCGVKVPVYDGKRRFDLEGTDQGMEYINEKGYGVYSGPAHRCDVDFALIAGQWKDHKNSRFWETAGGQKARDPFHIWLAAPAKGLPELPVRLESASAWGDIVVHLANWHYANSADIKTEFPQHLPQFAKAGN